MTLPVPKPGSFERAKRVLQQKMFENMRSYTSSQGMEGLWNVMYSATGAVPVDMVELTPESRAAMAATWSSDPAFLKIIGQNNTTDSPISVALSYMFYIACPHSTLPPPTIRECEIASAINMESVSHALMLNAHEAPPPTPVAYIPGSRKKTTPEKKNEKKKKKKEQKKRGRKAASEVDAEDPRNKENIPDLAPFDYTNPTSLPDSIVRGYFDDQGVTLPEWIFEPYDSMTRHAMNVGLYKGLSHRYVWNPLVIKKHQMQTHGIYCHVVNNVDFLERFIKKCVKKQVPKSICHNLVSMQDRFHFLMFFMVETGRFSDASMFEKLSDIYETDTAVMDRIRTYSNVLNFDAPTEPCVYDMVRPCFRHVFHRGSLPNFQRLLPFWGYVTDDKKECPYNRTVQENQMMHLLFKVSCNPMRVRVAHTMLGNAIRSDERGKIFEWILKLVVAFLCGYYSNAEPVSFYMRHVWYRRFLYRIPEKEDFIMFLSGFKSVQNDYITERVEPMRDFDAHILSAYGCEMMYDMPGLWQYVTSTYHGIETLVKNVFKTGNLMRQTLYDSFFGSGDHANRWSVIYTALVPPKEIKIIRTAKSRFDDPENGTTDEYVRESGRQQEAKKRPPPIHVMTGKTDPGCPVLAETPNPIHLDPERPTVAGWVIRAAMMYYAEFIYGVGKNMTMCDAMRDDAFVQSRNWAMRGGAWHIAPKAVIKELAVAKSGGYTPLMASVQLSIVNFHLHKIVSTAWKEHEELHGSRKYLHTSEFARYFASRQKTIAKKLFRYVTPESVFSKNPDFRTNDALFDEFIQDVVHQYCGEFELISGTDIHVRDSFSNLHAISLIETNARCKCVHCTYLGHKDMTDDQIYEKFQRDVACGVIDSVLCSWPNMRLLNEIAGRNYSENVPNMHRNGKRPFWMILVDGLSRHIKENSYSQNLIDAIANITETEQYYISNFVRTQDPWEDVDVDCLSVIGVSKDIINTIKRVENFHTTSTYPAEASIVKELIQEHAREVVLLYLLAKEVEACRLFSILPQPIEDVARCYETAHFRQHVCGPGDPFPKNIGSYYVCNHGEVKGMIANPANRASVCSIGPSGIVVDPITDNVYCNTTLSRTKKPSSLTNVEMERIQQLCRNYSDAVNKRTVSPLSDSVNTFMSVGTDEGVSAEIRRQHAIEKLNRTQRQHETFDAIVKEIPTSEHRDNISSGRMLQLKKGTMGGRGPSAHSRSRTNKMSRTKQKEFLETVEPEVVSSMKSVVRGRKTVKDTRIINKLPHVLTNTHCFKGFSQVEADAACTVPLKRIDLFGKIVNCKRTRTSYRQCSQCLCLTRYHPNNWTENGYECNVCNSDMKSLGIGDVSQCIGVVCILCKGTKPVLHPLTPDMRPYILYQDEEPVHKWILIFICSRHECKHIGEWSAGISSTVFKLYRSGQIRAICKQGPPVDANSFILIDNLDRYKKKQKTLGPEHFWGF